MVTRMVQGMVHAGHGTHRVLQRPRLGPAQRAVAPLMVALVYTVPQYLFSYGMYNYGLYNYGLYP